MIITNGVELALFAEKNNWLLTDKSDGDDLKLDDDYLCYLTPQGNSVLVRFWITDGKIKQIITR
jgi:hypothetical protein